MATAADFGMVSLGVVWQVGLIAVLVAIVYLYVRTRLRGTLWLLIWKSPIMALGAYLYLRSGWRWPKSLLIWVPFGLVGLAGEIGKPYLKFCWMDYVRSYGTKGILGMTTGRFIMVNTYVLGLIATALLLAAVIFLTQDLLRLTRPVIQEATPELES